MSLSRKRCKRKNEQGTNRPMNLEEWLEVLEKTAEEELKEMNPDIRNDYIAADTWKKVEEKQGTNRWRPTQES